MPNAIDLVTVGGLTVDNVIAADGRVGLGQAGGNGAYAAVGARLCGMRVGLVSHAVASYPRDVINRLQQAGIDLGGVVWSEARLSAGSWFIYQPDGQRDESLQSAPEALAEAGLPTDRLTPEQIAVFRAYLAARPRPEGMSYLEFRLTRPLTPDQVPAAYRHARGVHLAPSQPEVIAAMLAHFAPSGALITADPGWQLAAQPLDRLAPILSRLDAFLPSEVELSALLPGAQPAAALAALAQYCPGALAVKLGPRGVLVWDRDKSAALMVPAFAAATVDPTGAGDAFCGGFLAGLVDTRNPVQAAARGAWAASRVVAAFGADGALESLHDTSPASDESPLP
ncbi:MAG: carbohydrate kinase family protein [Roseinatronobacter sp.]